MQIQRNMQIESWIAIDVIICYDGEGIIMFWYKMKKVNAREDGKGMMEHSSWEEESMEQVRYT